MSNFKRFGGMHFNAHHNIVKNNIHNSFDGHFHSIGQSTTKEKLRCHFDLSGNSLLHIGSIYFNDGTYTSTSVSDVQGSKGSQGSQGSQGNTGAQGVGAQGDTGFPGNKGNTGSQGNTGAQGYTGSDGIRGAQGAQGNVGHTGFKGMTGFQGNTGFGSTYIPVVYYHNNSSIISEPIIEFGQIGVNSDGNCSVELGQITTIRSVMASVYCPDNINVPEIMIRDISGNTFTMKLKNFQSDDKCMYCAIGY
jgi:hypothetical protein